MTHIPIAVDALLIAIGRVPTVKGLGLEEAGIEYDERDGIQVTLPDCQLPQHTQPMQIRHISQAIRICYHRPYFTAMHAV